MADPLIRRTPSKIDLLNNSGPCSTDSPDKTNNFSEQGCSKKSVQQGRSPFGARSVRSEREHGTRARTPLAAFFNSPKIILIWLGTLCLLSQIFWPTFGMGYTDRIVAIVNKEVITWFDLEHETRDEYSRLKAKFSGEELGRRYTQKQREVLNELIVERLQLQEAKDKGISVNQDEIDAAIRRNPLPATQTEEEFGQDLLLKKLFDFAVRRNVVVEEEELRRYYNANPTLFRTPPQYQLKHIFFEATKEDDRTRARAKAQAIYEDWLPEIALEDLAAQHAQSVRELGWVQEKDLLAPIEQALQEMIPGTLSRPIETPTGVHLLLYDEVKEPQLHLFEEVERDIRAKLLKERGEEAYNEWMNKLKQQAFIDIKL